jgi:hypothetical protein
LWNGKFRVHWKYPDQDGALWASASTGSGPVIKADLYQTIHGYLLKVQLEYIGRSGICINMNLLLLTAKESKGVRTSASPHCADQALI